MKKKYTYYLSVSNPEYEERSAELESKQKYTNEQLEKILKESCAEAVERGEIYHCGERMASEEILKRTYLGHDEIFESGIQIMVNEKGFKHTKPVDAACSIDPYGHCAWMQKLEEKMKSHEYQTKLLKRAHSERNQNKTIKNYDLIMTPEAINVAKMIKDDKPRKN